MKSRSLFSPLLLIAVGLIWMLINLGAVPSTNLWALYSYGPYFILTLGIGLVLRARWELAGRIVSALAVGLAVLAVVFAAPLGWDKALEWGCFSEGYPGKDCSWFMDDGGSIPGSGVVISESRPLPEFTAVSIEFPSDVVIRQGETQSVIVEAEDNMLPQLETRIANGVFYIQASDVSYGERVSPTEMVRITLTVRDLNQLDFSTAGSVTVEGLQTDSLSISISGAGEVHLSGLEVNFLNVELSGAGNIDAAGTAGNLQLEVSGAGKFEGGELATQTAQTNISGMGTTTVWVAQQLTAEISGVGTLNYFGSPHVDQSISGVGNVHSLGEK